MAPMDCVPVLVFNSDHSGFLGEDVLSFLHNIHV